MQRDLIYFANTCIFLLYLLSTTPVWNIPCFWCLVCSMKEMRVWEMSSFFNEWCMRNSLLTRFRLCGAWSAWSCISHGKFLFRDKQEVITLQHTEDVLWMQLRSNASAWSCWSQRQNPRNGLTSAHLPVPTSIIWLCGEVHVCMRLLYLASLSRSRGRAKAVVILQPAAKAVEHRYFIMASFITSGTVWQHSQFHPLPLTPFLTPFCRCTGPLLISSTPVSSSPGTSVVVPPLTLCLIQFLISTHPSPPACLPSSFINPLVVKIRVQ